jgi:glycine cleavage system protein P-like pyridoxal-binding family
VGKRIPRPQGPCPAPPRRGPGAAGRALAGDGPDFPDLSEVDVVRHFTKLSQWNFGVDSGMYPLGSCTMKYNPKTNERQASMPGLPAPTPCCPKASPRVPWS